MNTAGSSWAHSYLFISFIALFIAQFLKIFTTLLSSRKLDISRLVESGGMPSSHSSFVTSLATAIGFREGFESPLFALSVVFAMIVMYDAAGVRRAVGRQARILNSIIDDFQNDEEYVIDNTKLKELIGHTPVEVFAGALLGIFVAWGML